MGLKIKVKYFDHGGFVVPPLSVSDKGDWVDLRAAADVNLTFGDYAVIPLGVGMMLPEGYEAHVVPRSSTFSKWHIVETNGMGIIDNSYCGENDEWGMPVVSFGDTHVRKGDRICQFRIVEKMGKPEFVAVDRLRAESRGGFGSTGTN